MIPRQSALRVDSCASYGTHFSGDGSEITVFAEVWKGAQGSGTKMAVKWWFKTACFLAMALRLFRLGLGAGCVASVDMGILFCAGVSMKRKPRVQLRRRLNGWGFVVKSDQQVGQSSLCNAVENQLVHVG